LLIGTDVLVPQGITVDLTKLRAYIASCQNAEFVIRARAKPKHKLARPVHSLTHLVLPPHSEARIPIKVKSALPSDRDYIFEPSQLNFALYAHAVDSEFSFVHAQNQTNKPVTIPRATRLGTLAELDLLTAYQVDASAAGLAATIQPSPLKVIGTMTEKTTVTATGATIYGSGDVAKRLETVLQAYDVWRDKGQVDIPIENWMRIPLVDDWQSKIKKNPVYPLGCQDRAIVDETFDKLHEQGRMRWADSHTPSGYPVFVAWRLVNQPDGSRVRKGRTVVDIRNMNRIVEPDIYPLPAQQEIIQMVAGRNYVSVIDAASFFYQWRIHPQDRRHLSVISHRGQEIFNVAIMGYCNSAAYVQRQIDNILRDHRSFSRAYIDDIVIASKTLEEHERHLHAVLATLAKYNISLNPAKSFIGFPSIQLLGQRVDSLGLSTLEGKLKAIVNLEFPRTLRQLETYLGMTGALRQYIEGYSWKIEPLQQRKTLLLKNSPTKGPPRKRFADRTVLQTPSPKELDAFNQIRTELSATKFLYHHDPSKQLYADMDSSKERGHGAMIYHIKDSYQHRDLTKPPPKTAILPIIFLSRTLSPAESKYWPTELEISGLVWVVRKIRHLVEAAPLELPPIFYTDHSSSADLATQTSLKSVSVERLNLRLVRASQYLQQFRIKVYHRPGKTNAVADALSRLLTGRHDDDSAPKFDLDTLYDNVAVYHTSLVELAPDFKGQFIAGYLKDPKWAKVLELLNQENQRKDPKKTNLPYYIHDGLLYTTGNNECPKLCIPRTVVPFLFELAHDKSGHQGFARSYERLQGLAICKGSKLLRQYIKACPQCEQYSTKRHKPYGSLQPILPPPIPFHTLTIDIIMSRVAASRAEPKV
jgi:RNase H-like domain found in reverse transcriptase/Reverse transcriptase (RNA-dependent DNA polymerase)/Integrase zinc binding domain